MTHEQERCYKHAAPDGQSAVADDHPASSALTCTPHTSEVEEETVAPA